MEKRITTWPGMHDHLKDNPRLSTPPYNKNLKLKKNSNKSRLVPTGKLFHNNYIAYQFYSPTWNTLQISLWIISLLLVSCCVSISVFLNSSFNHEDTLTQLSAIESLYRPHHFLIWCVLYKSTGKWSKVTLKSAGCQQTKHKGTVAYLQ